MEKTDVAQGPVDWTVSRPTVEDFDRWEPNIEVAVWGRGKATADKSACPMDAPPKAKYKGDCDNCEMFMGIRFPKDMDEAPAWGDRFKACCWAKVDNLK